MDPDMEKRRIGTWPSQKGGKEKKKETEPDHE